MHLWEAFAIITARYRRPRRGSNARLIAPQLEALTYNTPNMSEDRHYPGSPPCMVQIFHPVLTDCRFVRK